jgi:hypothetical protein
MPPGLIMTPWCCSLTGPAMARRIQTAPSFAKESTRTVFYYFFGILCSSGFSEPAFVETSLTFNVGC